MDFYQIKERSTKRGTIEVYPDFKVCRSKDLMVRGKAFYAIWDEANKKWSTDEYDVQRIVDADILAYKEEVQKKTDEKVVARTLNDYSSKMWSEFKNYVKNLSDNSHQLDEKIMFANSSPKKKDYSSKNLPYSLEEGDISAYDELMSTLYADKEREKLEWAVGAILSGDAKDIQKFIVLYGEGGTGKSTVLKIIQKIFDGYYTTFDAKALTSNNNAFSTEVFKGNPLVGIQHDGDLSRIEDNTKLNSIVSHEEMTINEKYKSAYTMKINCFLFLGTNKPVKITDAKSGVIRRLIDVSPTGKLINPEKYSILKNQIEFEIGAIAYHCLEVYRKLGKNYYSSYRPIDMIYKTDVFFNFVESNYHIFKEQNGTTLTAAYEMYKRYCDDTLVEFKLPKYKFREELKNYFGEFEEIARIDGKQVRSHYSNFLDKKFSYIKPKEEYAISLVLDCDKSIFDEECCDCPAQYATSNETPTKEWSEVTTKLKDIDTSKIHYVKVPNNHIVIDFDLKDKTGKKSFELNLKEASKFPSTYAEVSKGGKGIHLHYIYDGDVSMLSRIYSENIEIKVFNGNASLRRKLTKCNNVPIRHINSGLPLKESKNMINFESFKSEKALRTFITKNLNKEIHANTKPSMDFIYKGLEDAYNSGLKYDVTDMRNKILAFANNSTNNAKYCINLMNKMKFKSEEEETYVDSEKDEIVFFDVEVFPNLFLINWKLAGEDNKCVRMVNPTPADVEELLKFRLIGFNNRRYDNHILYGRLIGYSNEQLYNLSQKIINNGQSAMFMEAYNLSYTDVYDFSSAVHKKSLKKWEIELGIHHQELGLPWDQPVPEDMWVKVAEYCDNDVLATEAVFNHLSGDWVARQLLSELSGLSVNHTTNQHSTKIIFGNDKNPKTEFVYTDLSEMFPGYKFDRGKSTYRDEEVSEGGYVYAEPGMHVNVALLDIESMHPSSIIALNLFGEKYTQRFKDLKDARLLIKNMPETEDYKKYGTVEGENREKLETILGGAFKPFIDKLNNREIEFSDLANALKTVINSVYGLTFASFDNAFRDPRNIDNIVAKRGALFMVDLKHAIQEQGYTVAHIKTDSVKIPNADDKIIEFAKKFALKYGYKFKHEATYEKMCLVNNAVYIAKYSTDAVNGKHAGEWTATGAQFQVPYVFKSLFSKENIEFSDLCETKSVNKNNSNLYLCSDYDSESPTYTFIGKVGSFCPIKKEKGGAMLLRSNGEKYDAVTGTKDYYWLESEMVKTLHKEDDIDYSYYNSLVDDAIENISQYGDFEWFVDDSTPPFDPP